VISSRKGISWWSIVPIVLLLILMMGCAPAERALRKHSPAVRAKEGAMKARANVRAALPAVVGYYAEHGTYKGMTVEKLKLIDYGIGDTISLGSVTAESFCMQSTVGAFSSHISPPASPEITAGPCK
jgi:hypothetical protein